MRKERVLRYVKMALMLAAFSTEAYAQEKTEQPEIPGVVATIPQPEKRDVIVQLFNWKFAEVEAVIPQLRLLGYSHIHVSPPERSREDLPAEWWKRYQPIDYNEISGPLGDEAAYRHMNAVAEQYGMKIFGDAVLNHMAGRIYQTDAKGVTHVVGKSYYVLNEKRVMTSEDYPDFSPEDFHPYAEITSWEKLEEVRVGWMYGDLPDLDTGKPAVQKKLSAYLLRLLDMGVDAFRIDATVHFTPEDLAAILKPITKDIRLIGEIPLRDTQTMRLYFKLIPNIAFYDFPLLNCMHTAFSPKGDLRNLVNPASRDQAFSGKEGITWINSHDVDRGAASARPEEGLTESFWKIETRYRMMAYAYILGRADGTPYVFVDMKNPKPLVDAYPDERYDRPEIVAGVRFHNLSLGKPEIWLVKEQNRLIWQRGSDGFVIINKGDEPITVTNLPTKLAPGIYTEISHGYNVTVNKQSILEKFNGESSSFYFFVKTGEIPETKKE